MKCSASLTTSTAASAPAVAGPIGAGASDDAERTEAVKAFEGLVTSMIVKPISDSMGPMGGMFGDVVARAAIGRKNDTP